MTRGLPEGEAKQVAQHMRHKLLVQYRADLKVFGSKFAFEAFKFGFAMGIREALFDENGLVKGIAHQLAPAAVAHLAEFGAWSSVSRRGIDTVLAKMKAPMPVRWAGVHGVAMALAMELQALRTDVSAGMSLEELLEKHISLLNGAHLSTVTTGFIIGRPDRPTCCSLHTRLAASHEQGEKSNTGCKVNVSTPLGRGNCRRGCSTNCCKST